MYYSQYGEENVINAYFNNRSEGLCIDVGAADGIRYSNSRYLIESLGWSATLVEPHPTYYINLQKLYNNNDKIKLLNYAVYAKAGTMPFYLYGHDEHAQVSTLSDSFKEKVCVAHGDKYEEEPEIVNVVTLESILATETRRPVDFLSIDCEGVDMEVLMSNNWEKYRPSLVCVEHSMPKHELDDYAQSISYSLLCRTAGNSFFIKKENRKIFP